jgi:hypothetical protein
MGIEQREYIHPKKGEHEYRRTRRKLLGNHWQRRRNNNHGHFRKYVVRRIHGNHMVKEFQENCKPTSWSVEFSLFIRNKNLKIVSDGKINFRHPIYRWAQYKEVVQEE